MISNTIKNWLQRINQPESWLDPKLSDLSDQTLILDRDILIKRVAQEIRFGGLIVCYGDYDLDGSASAVILADAIQQMGGRAKTVLASRFSGERGGYGFNDVACDQVLSMGASLVVTLDCGSSDHTRIQKLRDHGVSCCVIDHHLVPKVPLPVDGGFLNPHRENCPSEFKYMASGGLALSVVVGLRRELNLPSFSVSQFYGLSALATIGDVAPLISDNRIITRAGLKAISKGDRPGIQALMEISKVPVGEPVSGRDVAFRIAPPLNSPGRLGAPDIIVDLLLSKDLTEARKIAASIKEIWDKRRIITEEVTAECIKQVDSNDYTDDAAIVVFDHNWGHGIVGISAARLVDIYKVPVCVIGHEGRGSLRGPPGSKLHTALTFCKEHLLKFGGHEAASGCQCAPESVEAFRQKFCEFFKQNPPLKPLDEFDPILDLDLEDNLLKVCDDINLCEPCGQGNPRPVIQTTGIITNWKQVKGMHIKFDLRLPNKQELPCFQIGNGETQETRVGQKVTVQGDLRKNTWNGRTKAEMFVQNIII